MTFTYRYRKEIIIVTSIIIVLISIITGLVLMNKKETKEEPIIIEKKEKKEKKEKEKKEIYKVDIKGEINSPGIYSLDSNSRVIDVIELAGGLTVNADTSVINLSKKIIDEMVIIIYSKYEVSEFKKTKQIEEQVQEKCIKKDEESLKNDACINSEVNSSENKVEGKISINTASKEQLMTLPGIGEAKAKDIIQYREKNGPFKTIEDLTKVSGIGDSTLAQIKENITT